MRQESMIEAHIDSERQSREGNPYYRLRIVHRM